MSTRGFSRRDLLHLGGKLVMTVGAAKIVVALPGCGGDDGGGTIDATPSIDAPPPGIDAYDYYHYPTLDDCHFVGTYDYALSYPGSPGYPAYTYHYYFTNAYGCAYYVYYPPPNVYCYYAPYIYPGYDYFCFSSYYETTTMP